MRDEKIITAVMNKLISNGYELSYYYEGVMMMSHNYGKEVRSVCFGNKAIVFGSIIRAKDSTKLIDEMIINYENISLESLNSQAMFVCNCKTKERWSLAVGRKSNWGDIYTNKQGA